eukprot:GFYU01018111.1.p1 GENE.GFYU01018111.1~~GFYU01018111.1.p1  ORF type:complete len:104 (-),score=38.72 GFYU01018111.1:58-369(-)
MNKRDKDKTTEEEFKVSFEHPRTRDVLHAVEQKKITEEVLSSHLKTHIDQIDAEQALETVTAAGLLQQSRKDIFITPLNSNREYAHSLSNGACEISLFKLHGG